VFAATGLNDSGTLVYLTEGRAVYTVTAGGTPFQLSTGGSGILPAINKVGTVAYGPDASNNSILTPSGTGDAQTLVSDTALSGSVLISWATGFGPTIPPGLPDGYGTWFPYGWRLAYSSHYRRVASATGTILTVHHECVRAERFS
jgi:hypothetical protein